MSAYLGKLSGNVFYRGILVGRKMACDIEVDSPDIVLLQQVQKFIPGKTVGSSNMEYDGLFIGLLLNY